jgi:glycosyltransferase involved in cell wall biosynthesis
MDPLISVIMPVYNCENYVYQAIESILNQTEGNFELLVIDDASTDGTTQVINTITDDRLQLITKPKNTGLTHSLNMGLELAKGKYIARMDGDDISLPTRFEKQLAAFNQNPNLVVCGTWYETFGSASTEVVRHPTQAHKVSVSLLNEASVAHPSVLIAKHRLPTGVLKYDTAMEPAEDFDLWTRLVAHGDIINLPEVLLLYRVHTVQTSQARKGQQLQKSFEIREHYFQRVFLNGNFTPFERNILLLGQVETVNDFLHTEKLVLHWLAANPSSIFNTWLCVQLKQARHSLINIQKVKASELLVLLNHTSLAVKSLTAKQKLYYGYQFMKARFTL